MGTCQKERERRSWNLAGTQIWNQAGRATIGSRRKNLHEHPSRSNGAAQPTSPTDHRWLLPEVTQSIQRTNLLKSASTNVGGGKTARNCTTGNRGGPEFVPSCHARSWLSSIDRSLGPVLSRLMAEHVILRREGRSPRQIAKTFGQRPSGEDSEREFQARDSRPDIESIRRNHKPENEIMMQPSPESIQGLGEKKQEARAAWFGKRKN